MLLFVTSYGKAVCNMAMTAAERMREYRKRQQTDRKARPVEVFLTDDILTEAKARAESKKLTLRQYLSDKIVSGIEAEGVQLEPEKVALAFVNALPYEVFTFVDDEHGRGGGGDVMATLTGLLLDGVKHREAGRMAQTQEQPTEHEKPTKKTTGKRRQKVVG